jgi:cytochrome c oxidase subunit 2
VFENFSLWPHSASTVSGDVDRLYLFLVGMSVFFSVLIVAALVVFSVRYRRREGVTASRIEGSLLLELLWSGIPLILCLFIFAWGTKVFVRVQSVPGEAMQFHVTGKQWMWKIKHPTGQSEINSLHVPVGQTIVLTMISEDVIHDFFVPAFRVKKDVLPGQYTQMWFEATRTGRYHLFCAEYCGTKHSEMIGEVVVMDPAQYQQWLDGQPAASNPVEAGLILFQNQRCDTCHLPGSATGATRGPDLRGRFGTEISLADGQRVEFDEAYVRESLLEPTRKISAGFQPLMPSFRGQLREDEILALIEYIKSLTPAAGEAPQ